MVFQLIQPNSRSLPMKSGLLLAAALLSTVITSKSQVNSGSDGHDGAFNPTQNVEIDMADHPDGIYHYTSVNIPSGVTVTFKPNAANTPVVWLVQGDCLISGDLSVNAIGSTSSVLGCSGGPGGWGGGNAALSAETLPGGGFGPGGGTVGTNTTYYGGNGSFATAGERNINEPSGTINPHPQFPAGSLYGNQYGLPLLGGSGGSGGRSNGAGGGGGSIQIASSGAITVTGSIKARGGDGYFTYFVPGYGSYSEGSAGAGSGGAIRLVGSTISGGGTLDAGGGSALYGTYNNYPFGGGYYFNKAGHGRIRLDSFVIAFNGPAVGVRTDGFQPIILPPANQAVSLAIQTVAGVAVALTPAGQLTSPDVIVPAVQQNPISIVVGCTNIPLGTEIIVDVKPANGTAVRAVALNNTGTKASSTATVQVTMPRGGGTIQAKAVSGIQLAANDDPDAERHSIAQTGWTADGERFKAVEVTAGLGTASQLVYLTESGKRYTLGSR